jgi:predicted aspartyl protease
VFLAFTFAAAVATQSAIVPFSVQANHLVIPVTIDGKPTHALFDTGGGNAIDRGFAERLGLKEKSDGNAGGAGEGTVKAFTARVRTLRFGPFTMRDQTFEVLPLPGTLTRGNDVAIDAIVGREILQRYVTKIDYDTRTLTFTPPSDFTYEGHGTAVPLLHARGAALVQGTIDGLAGTFQIDTGSSASLILTSPFVAAHDLRAKYDPVGNMVVGRGIGGYTRADVARGGRLDIGGFSLDDFVVELSTDTRGAFASRRIDGNVGNDVLRRITFTLDYARHVAYLEPNSRSAIPSPPDRAGLYVQNDDRRFFEVVSVLEGGPAYQAGLRPGERITAIDGTPALDVTMDAFWRLLRGPPGETHEFTVERDGTDLTISVTLREIV